jgi:anti-sigma regulatory factor (Ser/Thr protein kinase)/anti-anti-sigma regulatory factor
MTTIFTIKPDGPDFNWGAFQWISKRLHTLITKEKATRINLDFSAISRAFPNGMVPLIVLVDQCREQGIDFFLMLPQDQGCAQNIVDSNWAFYLAPDQGFILSKKPNALHQFEDDKSLNDLINTQIHQILERATYAQGVLQAFEWALNEIAGNALVHSEKSRGWLQVVVHPKNQNLAIVVADGGIGIPETIRYAYSDLDLSLDENAIVHALKEGITSKPDFGQGKGLTGTLAIVKKNKGGRLAIHSQSGLVEWVDDRFNIKGDFPPFCGTLIDIQLNISESIDVENALWGEGPIYPFNESLFGGLNAPIGVMQLKLADEASSFGNRITGQRIHQKIENLLITAPDQVLEIDFQGIDLMASSFADEVFGKLVVKIGFVGFMARLKLLNLNRFCRSIVDDVVQSRIVQKWKDSNF